MRQGGEELLFWLVLLHLSLDGGIENIDVTVIRQASREEKAEKKTMQDSTILVGHAMHIIMREVKLNFLKEIIHPTYLSAQSCEVAGNSLMPQSSSKPTKKRKQRRRQYRTVRESTEEDNAGQYYRGHIRMISMISTTGLP